MMGTIVKLAEKYDVKTRKDIYKMGNISENEIKELLGEENIEKIGNGLIKLVDLLGNIDFKKLDELITSGKKINESISKIKEIGDSKTNYKLKKILDSPFSGNLDLKELERQINELENKLRYCTINQNSISNTLIYTLPQLKDQVNIQPFQSPFVEYNGVKFEISNYKEIEQYFKKSVTASKLLAFLIKNVDFETSSSHFNLEEYAKFRGVEDLRELNKQVIKDFKIIDCLGNMSYSGKNAFFSAPKVFMTAYKNREGKTTIDKAFTEHLKLFYAHITKSLFRMEGNSYLLGYYIYVQARTNCNGVFRLSIKKCLEKMNIPSYEEVAKGNRHFTDRIITPFEKAMDELSNNRLSIQFEEGFDYDIKEFFDGYIEIEIKDKLLLNCYGEVKTDRERKSIKRNKKNKSVRKAQALKLKGEGKTIKEISQIMNVNIKTIKNYFME